MKDPRHQTQAKIGFWRENDVLDFIAVVLLFTACIAISAFQQ